MAALRCHQVLSASVHSFQRAAAAVPDLHVALKLRGLRSTCPGCARIGGETFIQHLSHAFRGRPRSPEAEKPVIRAKLQEAEAALAEELGEAPAARPAELASVAGALLVCRQHANEFLLTPSVQFVPHRVK